MAAVLVVGLTSVFPAAATVVVLGGGVDARPFVSLTSGPLTPAVATLTVGAFNAGVFTPFASADATQPTFFNVGADDPGAGRWTGNAGDSSGSASPFNGLQIWFRLAYNGAGNSVVLLTSPAVFPVNGGGVGDSITIDSRTLTIPGSFEGSLGGWVDEANDRIVVFVPEPSTVLFGLIGGVALLRRRR